MKIGIAQALTFYNYYPFWYGFFTDLGIEIVLSDKTTKKTMSEGSKLVVSETCLPIKVYVGHIINLLDKGVDKILVPCVQSIAPKIYNCSKIRGLPDLIRNVVKRDFTLIDATLDKSEKNQGLCEFLKEAVEPFGITDFETIKRASKAGFRTYNNFNLMTRSGVSFKDALKNIQSGKVTIRPTIKEYPINVAVISHGYNIFDERVSMNIFDKLEKLDVKAFGAHNISFEQMTEGLSTMDSQLYWANEYEMTGACGNFINDNKIDGIITVTAFGCGPDSLMIERMTRKAKDFSKPILNLTIDEHTGEAGFVTRLEAFVDMLYRKKRASLVKNINIAEETIEYKMPDLNFEHDSNRLSH